MDNKRIKINIRIDGKSYPLTIAADDEEKYRLAAKNVNEIVTKFRQQFGDQDTKDILAMTAFQFSLKNVEKNQRDDKTLFIDGLKNLNDDIADFVSEIRKK